ncbi:MAG: hypothetical protein PQ612_07625 [Rickettsiales bacterium]|nr:hypothetical protein [Pseudomonadota bacterium]MDA0966957.1 hypothetical protein [Pseudomonadota bacterium]MDG4543876.1 hypothetical protein [Rickettsiales bacterium]MDG4546022.1 hypothetical protein [Rickettsiales bacterium]MDG4548268.1 hypothetical protein [Rickettsiales bacterium]
MKSTDKSNRNGDTDKIIKERIILKGRGGDTNKKEGNRDYRNFLEQLKPYYKSSGKDGKRSIIATVNETLLANGYNLANENGKLVEKSVLDEEFYKKTSQALRESAVYKDNANNPELVQEMVGKVKEKLKESGQTVFDDESLSSFKKRVYVPETEASNEKTWVNRVVRRYSEKSPIDSFTRGLRGVESPVNFTEKDFEKEIKDEVLNGGGFLGNPEKWQESLKEGSEKAFNPKVFSK